MQAGNARKEIRAQSCALIPSFIREFCNINLIWLFLILRKY